MRISRKAKTIILSALSLFVVGTAAVSTAAWFTLEAQTITTDMVTADPNITIDNDEVRAHKIAPNISQTTGFLDTSSTTLTTRKGTAISTNNDHQATADTNFNVPTGGVGYYLVKKNPANSYLFSYYGVSYSWKLESVLGTKRYRATGVSLSSGDKVKVYRYDFVSHKTNIAAIELGTCTKGGSLDTDTDVVTLSSDFSGEAWFTLDTSNDLSFNGTITLTGLNARSKARTGPSSLKTRAGTHASDASGYAYLALPRSDSTVTINGWDNLKDFYIWTSTSSYTSGNKDTAASNRSTGLIDDGNYYYYPISTSTKDLYLGFTQNKNGDSGTRDYYNIGHLSNTVLSGSKSLTANTVYYVTDLHWLSSSNASEYWYGDSNYNSFNATSVTNPTVVGMTVSTTKITTSTTTKLRSTTTKTYYLYDPNAVLGDPPTVYYWADNVFPANNAWPGDTMTKVTDYLYSVTISTSYNKVIFNNGGDSVKTGTLTLPISTGASANNAFNLVSTSSTDSNWYRINNAGSTYTYYFYDPRDLFGSQPYAHYWRSTNQYNGVTSPVTTAMTDCSSTADGLWSITISERYDRILFASTSTFTLQTGDIEISSSLAGTGHYYWISGATDSNGKYTGGWYTQLPNSATRTFYLFDNKGKLEGTEAGVRYAYAWNETYKENNTGGTLAQWNNAPWPGIQMTKVVDNDYMWSITVSTSYDKIIFGNGGDVATASNQTVDSSVGDTGSTTVGADGWHFVLSAAEDSGSGKWAGTWVENVFSVDLKYAYFIGSSLSSFASDIIEQKDTFGIEPFYPYVSGTTRYTASNINHRAKYDSTNGILYHFAPADEGDITWYTDEACTTVFSTEQAISANTPLYCKMVESTTDSGLTTIYIDADASGWNSSAYMHAWGDNNYSTGALATDCALVQIAPNFYSIIVPSDVTSFGFDITNGAFSGSNQTSDVTLSSGNSIYLYLTANGDANVDWEWKDISATTNIGEAVVETYDGSAWSATPLVELSVGDLGHYGTSEFSNWFVYELGCQLAAGTKFRVRMATNTKASSYGLTDSTTYTFDSEAQYSGSDLPVFLTDDGGGYLTTANYTGNARFNFYVCNDDGSPKVSVAMVPDYGNGYYIMNYSSTLGVDNYCNAIKMDTSSSTTASYTGFCVTAANTKIFIKSYLNAVDTPCTSVTTSPSTVTYSTVDNQDDVAVAVINFSSPGYFNISASGSAVTITEYTGVDNFFKLNPLDTSDVANSDAIKAQKTALILEVPFTTTNTYNSNITMSVSAGDLCEFVGTALYVSSTRLAPTYSGVYSTMMGDSVYGNLSNDSTITDCNSATITKLDTDYTAVTDSYDANTTYYTKSGNEYIKQESLSEFAEGVTYYTKNSYYAYILIDYLPTADGGDYTNFNEAAYLEKLLSFRLISTQV